MDAKTLLDTALSYTDNVNPSDGDYAARRLRLLQVSQEVCEEVWNYREWPFSYKRDTMSVTGSAVEAAMPTDFMELGRYGGVFDSTTKLPYDEIPYQELQMLRDGSNTTWPEQVFSIFGTTAGVSSQLKAMQVLPVANARTLRIIYRFVFPTLTDVASDPELTYIPSQYHNTVILAGVAWRSRKAKNEAKDWESAYRRGLAQMVARELDGKTRVSRMPRAVNNW